ncbi:MAG: YchF/TatD family DNA exonuclease [Deltaproteobacteria bacterium]|nr:YchF/TatD family DNA exonuclease [Deltaproteobacteria bacterium]
MKEKIIDTHAHLDDARFDDDRAEVIARAKDAGLGRILTVACWSLEDDTTKAARIAEESEGFVRLIAGVHPHDAKDIASATTHPYDTFKELHSKGKLIAIGEIGLDYHYDNSPKDIQRKVFIDQIRLARELELPIVVHTREAEEDTIAILKDEGVNELKGGVLHCFSGSARLAEEALALGFHLSFSGIITFPKAEELREVLAHTKIERILVETDCPYLAPVPHRGKRAEPMHVIDTARKVADVKGLSIDDVARITTLNAESLFDLNKEESVVEETEAHAKVAYKIRNSLYLNITNRCTNQCTFCAKFKSYTVKGHYLKLDHEPNFKEVLEAVAELGEPVKDYDEIVFCGFGESLIRLDLVKKIGLHFKKQGCRIRIDTDGLANLVHGGNVLRDLKFVDVISVSLNAADADTYDKLCRTPYGKDAFPAVLFFIREAKKFIPKVQATVVAVPGLDVEACRRIAEDDIGVTFRVREYNEVG